MPETTPEPEPGPSNTDGPGPGPAVESRRRAPIGPRVVGAVLLLTGLYLLWEAWKAVGDDELTIISPRIAPLIVTGMWVLFAAIYLVRQLIDPTADYPVPEPSDEDDDAHAATDTVHDPIDWRTPALVAVLLVAYVLLLEHAGFVLSTAVFYLATSRVLGSRKWIRDIIVAVVLALGVYLAFTRLLDIVLPEGVLPL
ncbi:tripartite tricarboxylate transporter TctB family protein [Phytomonospora endophytica]|uniref:Putative tricarboxylic transport membrane protein n=1 Tax=Phytomonospora endophytica TaxID=714109 RepID=A0A841FLI7_9ACTN|nr:tripartite tricarboxylate transporter TctB family protein [Phytomonospora endophytica]MBB6034668.1 putative tricarboxylic transport membrane protein [Phytomonospora endophytica]GIG69131.1 hypothetical protein Pen01_54260 [Phytomonospora endophytica]